MSLLVNGPAGKTSVQLGQHLSSDLLANAKYTELENGIRVDFDSKISLEIKAAGECSEVIWTTADNATTIQDCIDYGTTHWYGGFEQKDQRWPIEKLQHSNYQYVTQELDNMGIAERYFLNSFGQYFYVEDYVPLFLDFNTTGQNQLCMSAKFEDPFLVVDELRLHYRICTLSDVKEAQLHAIDNIFGRPSALPDERMVQHPIWSTWVRYKRNISETIVMEFANEIANLGYENSQIEIDDDWETCYGELEFDLEKFPDPGRLVSNLRSLGFRVTLWIHPFMNENCPSFQTLKGLGYFAKDENGRTRTRWWNGLLAAIFDFTNPDAANYWFSKIDAIKAISQVDSFKFDAGETSWLPNPRVLSGPRDMQPNIYTSTYIRNVSQYGPLTEVRAGFRTQDIPLFVRMVDKDSRWTMNNGLRSIVTSLLAMNMAGYPYVLPDMIGGNNYFGEEISEELFIRWLQASTFMPSLQFSRVPWDFSNPEVDAISKKFVELHANYTPVFMQLAQQYLAGGAVSINNPIWMARYSPLSDEQAFLIDDEYLLGDEILVAPVMDEGAIQRDIYLPSGLWQDLNTGQLYQGQSWLYNYPAPLDTLPHFKLTAVSDGNVNTPVQKHIFFSLVLLVAMII
ncbi:myogenesis-regulating glycosidase-like [Cloeon dipterum]|uniref:myogenesis-regulating glycosidase-like n=1 Tax=Cloeon dipterum TaxID=197152 RepID=UPI00321FB828